MSVQQQLQMFLSRADGQYFPAVDDTHTDPISHLQKVRKGSAISTCRVWSISVLSIRWEIKTINDQNRYLGNSATMTANGSLRFAYTN